MVRRERLFREVAGVLSLAHDCGGAVNRRAVGVAGKWACDWAGKHSSWGSGWWSGLGRTTPGSSHSAGRPGFGVVHRRPRLYTQVGSPLHVGRAALGVCGGVNAPHTLPMGPVCSSRPYLSYPFSRSSHFFIYMVYQCCSEVVHGCDEDRSDRRRGCRRSVFLLPGAFPSHRYPTHVSRAGWTRPVRVIARSVRGSDVASAVGGDFLGGHQGEGAQTTAHSASGGRTAGRRVHGESGRIRKGRSWGTRNDG
jgi:hypothetical protein